MERLLRYVVYLASALVLIWTAGQLTRVLVCDSFIVRGSSMEPALHDGERVYVNKLKAGARIYTDLDFESPHLRSFRLPGFRDVRVGDIVVINDPYFRCKDSITFRINHVYIKRCYGAPGDTVRIIDGHYIHPDDGGFCGAQMYQDELASLADSVLTERGVYMKAWGVNRRERWTIKDLGPLYVPEKGGKVQLTPQNYRSYRKQIHFETGKWLYEKGGQVLLDGDIIREYEFLSDWYFLGGDNVLNSRDSRYVGLMPGSYIVGIVNGR